MHFHCAQSVEEVRRAVDYCEKVHTQAWFENKTAVDLFLPHLTLVRVSICVLRSA